LLRVELNKDEESVINCYQMYHDAITTILRPDGEVISIEEERLVRTRHALRDVANPNKPFLDSEILCKRVFHNDNDGYLKEVYANEYDHHIAHAYGALTQSGMWDQAAILVVDGWGKDINTEEFNSIAIFSANNGEIETKRVYDIAYSIGVMYSYSSEMVFKHEFTEGKFMGLATHGDAKSVPRLYTIDESTGDISYYSEAYPIKEEHKVHNNGWNTHLLNWIYNEVYPLCNSDADFAATIQKEFELIMFELVKYIKNTVGGDRLIISGGCGLNCTFNGKLLAANIFKDVYIPPMCTDQGSSIGVLSAYKKQNINKTLKYNTIIHPLPDDIKEVDMEWVANMLKSGKIVAWFEGGSEYGPRALCHRSLLAVPNKKDVADKVNRIKNRELWRPLAPVVLDTEFEKMFDCKPGVLHEFMLSTETVSEDYREKVPAVLAKDNTTRPQILFNDLDNSVLYSIMKSFDLPVLLNTSFNDRGEAICESPGDAIRFVNKRDKEDVVLIFCDGNKIYNYARMSKPLFNGDTDGK